MIWTKQHIKDFFNAQGHDPDEVLTRLAVRGSVYNDMEAWSYLREWYDRYPRMSKEMISAEIGISVHKVVKGLCNARQYMIQ